MTTRIMRSGIIAAPVELVWDLLRDFNSHRRWHPAIAESQMEAAGPVDQIGGVRVFRLHDGGQLREQLIAHSDREMSLSYCLLEAPVALHDYVARMQLKRITDGEQCLLVWESTFRPPAAQADALTKLVASGIYEAGIAALQKFFARPGTTIPASMPPPPPLPVPAPPSMGDVASTETIAGAAIFFDAVGGAEVMTLRAVAVPPPGPGEARLRQHAVGVNFIDVHMRSGDMAFAPPPGIPGVEAAGQVLDIGAGVTHVSPGDRVVYAGMPVGAYASHRNMPAEMLVRLPADIDDNAAAAIFLKGLLADALVEDVHPVRAGEVIVVRAAAGGVGLLLCQIARARGAHVIGVVSTADKVAVAGDAGCEQVVALDRDDLRATLDRMTSGAGADAVFDAAGNATFEESLSLLGIRGHLVSFGQVTGPVGPRDIDLLAAKSNRLSRPRLEHFMRDRAEIEWRAARLFDHLRHGRINPLFTALPLSEAAQAHRLLESRRNLGAVILHP